MAEQEFILDKYIVYMCPVCGNTRFQHKVATYHIDTICRRHEGHGFVMKPIKFM